MRVGASRDRRDNSADSAERSSASRSAAIACSAARIRVGWIVQLSALPRSIELRAMRYALWSKVSRYRDA